MTSHHTNEENVTSLEKTQEKEKTLDDKAFEAMDELNPKQKRFVSLHLTGQYSNPEIAKLIEVHPTTVRAWMKDERVLAALRSMEEATYNSVQSQMKALSEKAVLRLNDLIDSPIDGVALNAINSILDRTGHKSKSEIKVEKTVTTYERKMQDLIESTVIDAEIVDEE